MPKNHLKNEKAMEKEKPLADPIGTTDADIELAQNTDPDDDPATTPVSEEMGGDTSLASDYARMVAERDLLRDRMARMQAEFENARKRDARERQEFREFSAASALEPLLPVLDNFALALKHDASLEQLRSGVELIVKQLDDVLRSVGLQVVPTVGAMFDPRLHEAVGVIETKELPDHQIVEEVRRGYKLKERLLRPAMVKIAHNPTANTNS
jgi:molecular chaperone GrpE